VPPQVGFLGSFAALPLQELLLLLGVLVQVQALQLAGWLDWLAALLGTAAAEEDPFDGALGRSPPPPPLGRLPGSRRQPPSPPYTSHPPPMPEPWGPGHTRPPPTPTGEAAAAVAVAGGAALCLAVAMSAPWATLLLVRALRRPAFLAAVAAAGGPGSGSSEVALAAAGRRQAAVAAAVVLSCGLAPLVSPSASLVAVKWARGLRQVGVRLRCCASLAAVAAPAALAATALALLVVWAQAVL
jgi:hypothetical protein